MNASYLKTKSKTWLLVSQLIDKKPDDRSSAEMVQQQLCVLDTKPAAAETPLKDESNDFDNVVPDVEQEKVIFDCSFITFELLAF